MDLAWALSLYCQIIIQLLKRQLCFNDDLPSLDDDSAKRVLATSHAPYTWM